jgi:hypothetical protein
MSAAAIESGPRTTFRVTPKSRLARYGPHFMVAGIFGFLGLGFLAMSASRPETNTLSPGLVCFFGALGTFVYFAQLPPKGAREIELDAEGFAWVDGNGEHRVAWEEVATATRAPKVIVNGFVRSASTKLTLRDGRQVLLDYEIEGYDQLAELVQRLRASQILPELLGKVDSGQPLGFGPLSVDRAGIEHQGRHRPWGTFAYAFDSGRLVLVPAAGDFGWQDRAEIPLEQMPDSLALGHVLARFQPPTNPFLTIPPRDRESLARG